jgi:hypothetical protein
MQRKIVFPLISLFLCLSPFSQGQSWSGIINSSRAANWSNVGIPGGIPSRTTNCATLSTGASTSQINSAIASCPSGQVVLLSAGTYTISGGIAFNGTSNVTLRGAGPTKTILNFTGGDSCGGLGGDICMDPKTQYYNGAAAVSSGGAQSANWTAGYTQGATSITLDKAPPVNQMLILDQASDTSDTGGLFFCNLSSCNNEGAVSAPGRSLNGNTRSQQQVVTVTAVSGSGPYTVTISPGVYATNWRSSQAPGAWWAGQVSLDGVEDLTINNDASSANSGIYMYSCYECWVKNVISLDGNRNHVWFYQSARDVVRDSYFYGTHNGAEESYGIEPYQTSDDLVENNIFDSISSPDIGGTSEGMVWGFNYSANNVFNPNANWMQTSYASHNTANAYNLYEGNQFNGLFTDDDWGTSGVMTYFRNQLAGWQTGKTENTQAIRVDWGNRGMNFVGNVLGTTGYDTQYQASPAAGSVGACDNTVIVFGWRGVECKGATDNLVASTALRWGNYDTVNNATQWNPAEIPTTGVPYINGNPVPASQTLPASFYLSSKPTWWGSMPWPPIGPDVTGGTGPGGHAYATPAQVCYTNGSFTGGIMNFDASNCYGSSAASTTPPPAPPTNLSVTVQ